MTKWTPQLLDRVRALAETGITAQAVADALGVSISTMRPIANRAGIHFRGKTWQRRSERPAIPVLAWVPSPERVRLAARHDLDREIAAARAEAVSAPLYRGGWPT